jgi:hypothetical protein
MKVRASVVDDREVDPRWPHRLLYAAAISAFCVVLAALVLALLSWVGGSVPEYLAGHRALVWLLSAGLFTALWGHLAVLEYGRRDAAVRAAAWRATRTTRSSSYGLVGASGVRGSCRKCPGLMEENAALRMQFEAAQREARRLRDQLGSQPALAEIVGPAEQATREAT